MSGLALPAVSPGVSADAPDAPAARPGWAARIAAGSVRHRGGVLGVSLCLLLLLGAIGSQLTLDALPDITNNQVLVLTRAPGLSPEEVERLVTRPIEVSLGGMPGLLEQRSLSRFGISSVVAVFADDVRPFLARQIVQERLTGLPLPAGVEAPALGPLTGGLGEIFHFTLSSPVRTPAELLELATLQIAPRLRSVSGVVEVNTWGGAERTLDVRADAVRLSARGLTLADLDAALRAGLGAVAGESLPAGAGQALLRGVFRPRTEAELAAVLVKPGVSIADVAEIRQGSAPRLGAATKDGRGETVYLMAQMLRGDNALRVTARLGARLTEIRALLPRDVQIALVYDRSALVKGTLHTVGKNLLEGGLLVGAVLLLFLGSLRAGLLVALAIPLSMLGAVAGMVLLGVPGNLMSLGALDFGLLVDGSVVMIESLFHAHAHADAAGEPGAPLPADAAGFRARIGAVTSGVAQPVCFSVLIILLVYVPVLGLGGVEGKLFQPMALTVVLALCASLVVALTFMPAAASLVLRPQDLRARTPLLARVLERAYRPVLRACLRRPRRIALTAALVLTAGAALLLRAGSEFVPQLDEGDLVIQTTRAADVSLDSALREAGRLEAVLRAAVPEVVQVVSRVGSPAVATDIMGLEQADVFVTLRPREKWRRGLTREALVAEIDALLAARAPGGAPAFTQPIQMRFNEILAGAVTDVVVSVFGDDLGELGRLAERIATACRGVRGAADVKILAPPDVALVEVRPRPLAAAQAGLRVGDVLDAVQALRSGLAVGVTYDGPVRIPVRLRLVAPGPGPGLAQIPAAEPAPGFDGAPSVFLLDQVLLPVPGGGTVPLGRVADIAHAQAPSVIHRHDAERRILVGFNVRGADLGTVVAAAQQRVRAAVPLPAGYRIAWGGQSETLAAAKRRLAVLIPVVLLGIVALLGLLFRRARPALILLAHVPFACTGGMLALSLRGLPVSISAAIGFIALSGIAVLNGVVLVTRILELEAAGAAPGAAAQQAAETRLRPVLMTALVAALGFVPMTLAQGVGAEVQRPLATVVVGGLVTSTALTLLVLPTLYPLLSRRAGRGPVRASLGA